MRRWWAVIGLVGVVVALVVGGFAVANRDDRPRAAVGTIFVESGTGGCGGLMLLARAIDASKGPGSVNLSTMGAWRIVMQEPHGVTLRNSDDGAHDAERERSITNPSRRASWP